MIRLLFTSGRGPAECRIAVLKAVATLAAEAASLGLETDCLEGPNTDGHGPASAIVVIHGDAAAFRSAGDEYREYCRGRVEVSCYRTIRLTSVEQTSQP